MAAVAGDPRRIVQIKYWVFRWSELQPLIFSGQKAGAPQMRAKRLASLVFGDEDDKSGKVAVLAAKPVAEPCAHARASGNLRPSLNECHARPVVDGLGEHRADDAQIGSHHGSVWKQFADPSSTWAVLVELKRRPDHRDRSLVARHAGEPLTASH